MTNTRNPNYADISLLYESISKLPICRHRRGMVIVCAFTIVKESYTQVLKPKLTNNNNDKYINRYIISESLKENGTEAAFGQSLMRRLYIYFFFCEGKPAYFGVFLVCLHPFINDI